MTPTIKDLQAAQERISPYVHKTPVLTSSTFDQITRAKLFFKCENFQKTGSFKIRGATNAVLSLSPIEAKYGVATHSSGNHAQGVACAARLRKIPSYIVMTENAPEVKKAATKAYGAEITFCGPTLHDRETALSELVKRTQAAVIHPYNDARVIAGQGTATLELLSEISGLDLLIAPVGGGGLLSGMAIAAHGIEVIGAEPELADDAFRSLRDGHIYPQLPPTSIADGLSASLGELTFAVLREYKVKIVTVDEASILKTIRMIWERMKILIEPSSALPLAILLSQKLDVSGKRVGIVLSGGNVNFDRIQALLK